MVRDSLAARPNGLELLNIELLVDKSNQKIYTIGGRQINFNLINIEPQEESLNLNPLQIGDGAVLESAGDGSFVVDQVIERYVTRPLQFHHEFSIFCQGMRFHGFREKPPREAVLLQNIVGWGFWCGWGDWKMSRRGGRDEEKWHYREAKKRCRVSDHGLGEDCRRERGRVYPFSREGKRVWREKWEYRGSREEAGAWRGNTWYFSRVWIITFCPLLWGCGEDYMRSCAPYD